MSRNSNRKTKTFSEILNEKHRSGGRIGYNLHRYVDEEEEAAAAAELQRSAQKGKRTICFGTNCFMIIPPCGGVVYVALTLCGLVTTLMPLISGGLTD